MGADGHITIINKEKAVQILGPADFCWFMDNCPGCKYERNFNGITVITLYHGDNVIDDWQHERDWCFNPPSEEETAKARDLIEKIRQAEIDCWEVWT